MTSFAAIDFETADHGRDSACSVAVVLIEDNQIKDEAHYLIRPPRQSFAFTHIHGINWNDCKAHPDFSGVWPKISPLIDRANVLCAHNAPFDRGVLQACCELYGIRAPKHRFECTVQIARSVWDLHPTKLPDVCRHLGIALKHHDAMSDARACAQIMLHALRQGYRIR